MDCCYTIYSGGVRLTVNGSNLDLIDRPQMNVTLIFSHTSDNHRQTVRDYPPTVITVSLVADTFYFYSIL